MRLMCLFYILRQYNMAEVVSVFKNKNNPQDAWFVKGNHKLYYAFEHHFEEQIVEKTPGYTVRGIIKRFIDNDYVCVFNSDAHIQQYLEDILLVQ